jgi:hypothetical protein
LINNKEKICHLFDISLIKVHIATLCITISLCATVALACLFSPKVYIILLHPEKNMRLTKQLKAQANSIRFASQIPTNSDFMLNHHLADKDTINHDVKSTVLTANNTEGTNQPLISDQKKTLQMPVNNFDNSNQRKVPTIITTSHSDGYINDEKQRLSIKRYNYDDNDSLNSSFLPDEQIML